MDVVNFLKNHSNYIPQVDIKYVIYDANSCEHLFHINPKENDFLPFKWFSMMLYFVKF